LGRGHEEMDKSIEDRAEISTLAVARLQYRWKRNIWSYPTNLYCFIFCNSVGMLA
jgi:hypothetical protein